MRNNPVLDGSPLIRLFKSEEELFTSNMSKNDGSKTGTVPKTGSESPGNAPPANIMATTPYKVVISWFHPFDGKKDSYGSFVRECDHAFKRILPKVYSDLLSYVKAQLLPARLILSGSGYETWEDVKAACNEHFDIRFDEKAMFRELTSLRKESNEELYSFYNRLTDKCFEFGEFLKTLYSDKNTIKIKFDAAQDYFLDSFIAGIGENLRPTISAMKPKTIKLAYQALRELEMNTGSRSQASVGKQVSEVLDLVKEMKVSNNKESFSNPAVGRNAVVPMSSGQHQDSIKCQLCFKFGHVALDCDKFKQKNKPLQSNQNNNNNRGGSGGSRGL